MGMVSPHRRTELRGRRHECDSLDRLLNDVRGGQEPVARPARGSRGREDRVHTWCSANGCGARTGAWMRESSCASRTRGSAASGQRRSRSARAASCSRPVKQFASASSSRATCDRAGSAGRAPRGRGAHQPRDRRAAVHQPAHGRVSLEQSVHQTRHQLAPASSRRDSGHRGSFDLEDRVSERIFLEE